MKTKTAAVFGAGIAGLSAAHEFARLGYTNLPRQFDADSTTFTYGNTFSGGAGAEIDRFSFNIFLNDRYWGLDGQIRF